MKENDRVLLAHGSGGLLSRRLVDEVFFRAFGNEILAPLGDQALFTLPSSTLAFTTDSFVVNPLFFPGGDIGKLAVYGTVNDLAVGGAEPKYLSASFIIEEGMEMDDLRRVADSMAEAARASGVRIVTGDTKVVERGKGDRLFINTSGIGVVPDGVVLGPENIRPGDVVIVSGTVGDHGVAILAGREGLEMETPVESDCAPLWDLSKAAVAAAPSGMRAMRDATRGGAATVLCEFAESSGRGVVLREMDIPVRPEVAGACEMLGFDPLYLANEGKLVAVVEPGSADAVINAMRGVPEGRGAEVIGEVVEEPGGKVLLETTIGNRRILEMLSGEMLPRIC